MPITTPSSQQSQDLLILADAQIPYLEPSFGCHGRLQLVEAFTPELLAQADCLLLRTTTKLGPEVLAQARRLRWVGSPSIGTDHLDLVALKSRDIAWASAPGCNAQAVAEYVLSALATLAQAQGREWQGLRLGVVGAGNTGQAVARLVQTLGVEVRFCDPFLQQAGSLPQGMVLEELLAWAQAISLHVNLHDPPYGTKPLLDAALLALAKPGLWLINASRGEVLQERALLEGRNRLGGLVLDVWPQEPYLNPELLALCDLATPHIAGWSQAGKLRATEQIYQAFCLHFRLQPQWSWAKAALPPCPGPPRQGKSLGAYLAELHDLPSWHQAMHRAIKPEGMGFLALRQSYSFRPEFAELILLAQEWPQAEEQKILQGLGFRLS